MLKNEDINTAANDLKSKVNQGEHDDVSQHSKISRSHDSAFKPILKSGKSSNPKTSNSVTD